MKKYQNEKEQAVELPPTLKASTMILAVRIGLLADNKEIKSTIADKTNHDAIVRGLLSQYAPGTSTSSAPLPQPVMDAVEAITESLDKMLVVEDKQNENFETILRVYLTELAGKLQQYITTKYSEYDLYYSDDSPSYASTTTTPARSSYGTPGTFRAPTPQRGSLFSPDPVPPHERLDRQKPVARKLSFSGCDSPEMIDKKRTVIANNRTDDDNDAVFMLKK